MALIRKPVGITKFCGSAVAGTIPKAFAGEIERVNNPIASVNPHQRSLNLKDPMSR